MIELATLLFVGFVLFVAVCVLFALIAAIKVVFWLLLLPFRLLFGLLFLPFLVLKFLLVGVLAIVIAPIVALVMVGGLLAAAVAVLLPLLPFLFVAWLLYLLVRPASSTALVP